MNRDLLFAHDYEAVLPADIPGDGRDIFRIPRHDHSGGADGLLVLVKPANLAHWYGIFEFGVRDDYSECNGIYSSPNRLKLCVVSNGSAYLVDTADPMAYITIPAFPVVQVHCLLEYEVIIFVDFTTITAVGVAGIQWTTETLVSYGDIIISSIENGVIRGHEDYSHALQLDAPYNKFEVDVKTGAKSSSS